MAHKEVCMSVGTNQKREVTYHDVHVELPDELDFLGVGLLCETRVVGIAVDLLLLLDGGSLEVIGVGFLLIDGETMRVIDQVVGVSDLSRIHRNGIACLV
jgi:hypothetical protein